MADMENAPLVVSLEAARQAGLKRYYTGNPCSYGHIAERQVSSRACVLCQARRRKNFYHQNREAEIAKVKAHYQANRERIRVQRNAYDKANPEKKKAFFKAWYDQNRDTFQAKKAADRKANPEAFKARYDRWAKANPEHVLANIRRREARKKAAEGHHTGAEIKTLFKQQRGKCVYCRTALKRGYHADHIVPLSKGGSNWISNIQLTCSDCNHRKWAKDPLVWARQIGRLV